MKKLLMAMTLTFALGTMAQTSGSTTPSQGGNTGAGQGSSGSMQSSGSANNQGSMQDHDVNSSKNMKGEMKSMKGCIRQSNGMFMLEGKDGKMMNLQSSQDLSAHVGHEVKVHGMWQMSGSNSMSGSGSSSGTMASNNSESNSDHGMMDKDHMGKSFMVDKIDMVSDHCKMDKSKDSSMSK